MRHDFIGRVDLAGNLAEVCLVSCLCKYWRTSYIVATEEYLKLGMTINYWSIADVDVIILRMHVNCS